MTLTTMHDADDAAVLFFFSTLARATHYPLPWPHHDSKHADRGRPCQVVGKALLFSSLRLSPRFASLLRMRRPPPSLGGQAPGAAVSAAAKVHALCAVQDKQRLAGLPWRAGQHAEAPLGHFCVRAAPDAAAAVALLVLALLVLVLVLADCQRTCVK